MKRTISAMETLQLLKGKEISLLTLLDFRRLLGLKNQQTAYKKIQRLEKQGVLKKIIRGKYLFTLLKPSDFALANFLALPSYLSLESALSFYGIISGFPYQITSISLGKPKTIRFESKEFSYSQIKNKFFFGFEKKDDFLIAEKEKALFDYCYLASKGLRKIDRSELDLTGIDKKKLQQYFFAFLPREAENLSRRLNL